MGRRVIKQTVMTSVYGVTMIGARNQIASKLKEKFEDAPLEEDVKAHTVNVSSAYLAKVRQGLSTSAATHDIERCGINRKGSARCPLKPTVCAVVGDG